MLTSSGFDVDPYPLIVKEEKKEEETESPSPQQPSQDSSANTPNTEAANESVTTVRKLYQFFFQWTLTPLTI